MAWACRNIPKHPVAVMNFIETMKVPWTISLRNKFTKSRIPPEVFEERAKEHVRYGGDPDQPHKLHLVTRVKSVKRRPYWERKIVEDLGLGKAHQVCVHKNIPSVNDKLKIIKHLVKIQPLKMPNGLPAEEDIANTILKSSGELVVTQLLKPLEQKAIKS